VGDECLEGELRREEGGSGRTSGAGGATIK